MVVLCAVDYGKCGETCQFERIAAFVKQQNSRVQLLKGVYFLKAFPQSPVILTRKSIDDPSRVINLAIRRRSR